VPLRYAVSVIWSSQIAPTSTILRASVVCPRVGSQDVLAILWGCFQVMFSGSLLFYWKSIATFVLLLHTQLNDVPRCLFSRILYMCHWGDILMRFSRVPVGIISWITLSNQWPSEFWHSTLTTVLPRYLCIHDRNFVKIECFLRPSSVFVTTVVLVFFRGVPWVHYLKAVQSAMFNLLPFASVMDCTKCYGLMISVCVIFKGRESLGRKTNVLVRIRLNL